LTTIRPTVSQCLISFGSNLGQRESLIAQAAEALSRSPLVCRFRTSRLYETPPIGGPGGQEPFLNAVAALETDAPAREILNLLQTLETSLGRQRRQRWDSRSIDLDVVLHGQLVGGHKALVVPHPRYTARRFVLRPACDVAAHFRDPRFGWTLQRLADHLDQGLPSLALVGGDVQTRNRLCQRLADEHQVVVFPADPPARPLGVVANAPGPDFGCRVPTGRGESEIVLCDPSAWVSAFVPPLPAADGEGSGRPEVPRLIVRIQPVAAEAIWPAPHRMWPAGWRWPEYRLELTDLDWAVGELASALDSMRCPVRPVTPDGHWW
jgi:2-amino-4-hydroxy-6-hydroxymethyldihydropteridine diphosphokinase